jgi:hypothetical protein
LLKWHRALQANTLLAAEWQDKAFVPFKDGYGYGWQIDTISGRYSVFHSGHIHGYNANICRLPNEDVCIVVLTNFMKTGADPIAFTRDIVHAMYDPEYVIPEVCREIKLAEAIKKRYEGVYTLEDDSSLTFTFRVRKNQLFLRVTGQAEVPLLPMRETMFFTKVVDARVGFKKLKTGTYDMVLYQNGQELVAHRQ